jgi:hypothetical protein
MLRRDACGTEKTADYQRCSVGQGTKVTDHPRGPCRCEFAGRWFPSKQRAVTTYEHLIEVVEDIVEFDTLPFNNFKLNAER